MKKKILVKYIPALFASFLLSSPAFSFAGSVSGDLSIGGRFVGGNDVDYSAKFLEYRDIDDQVTTDLNLYWDNDGLYHGALGAKNIGYDDQSFALDLGLFGKMKLAILYDEMTHNYSLNDRTIYAGIGTATLTQGSGVDPTDETTWTPLDYAVDRKQIGAKLELGLDGSPFFVSFNVMQTDKDGVLPISIERSRSPHELPMPIDYQTKDMTVKAGYRTDSMFAEFDVSISDFDNKYSLIENWYSPNGATETFTLAPDNKMWLVGGKFVLRDLPVKSVLAIRGSHSKIKSDPVLTTADSFDGEITYSKAAIKLKSRPMDKFDTEISYNYLKKDNKAAKFNYDGQDTHIFEYKKQQLALGGGYRINSDNRINAGYDYETIDRANEMRRDAEETDEHTVFAEWKNTTFEMATAKIRFEHMQRSSDFDGVAKAAETGDDFYAYVRPFDAADKTQNKLRLQFEVSPTDSVDLGLEGNFSRGDYDETFLGRTDEKSHGFILDATIRLPKKAKLYAYTDYERREIDSRQVQARLNGTPATLIEILDGTFQDNDDFNWWLERIDVAQSFGVKFDIPLLNDRLRLSAGFDYQDNDGEANFTENAAAVTLENISSYDDYTKQTAQIKAEYDMKKNVTITTGLRYEKYEYDDILINDYDNTIGNDYFSGAYADLNYEAHIGYVMVKYCF